MAASSHEGGAVAFQPAADQSEPQRHAESWLDRLRQRLGFRGAPSLREDLEDALDEAEAGPDDDFTPEERLMLRNILGLRDLRVEDVMIPRADIEAVAVGLSVAEVLLEFEKAGHSRLPVFDETLDAPLGMVHIKDVVGYVTRQAMFSRDDEDGLDLTRVDMTAKLSELDIVRDVMFVPASMPAADLLVSMRANRVHMTLVIDEHGGTDGLVTMEDLVETVVGDIEDEHDEHGGPAVSQVAEGSFIADARAPLDEVSQLLGDDFDVTEALEEVDSIGGLLVTLVGRVPEQGEIIPGPGPWQFEVLEADPARVKRIRIERRGSIRPPDAEIGSGKPGRFDRHGETVAHP